MSILVTGGAGLVGLSGCRALRKAYPGATITALDNLSRDGSALRAKALLALGVSLRVADIADASSFDALEPDVLIHAAAEASVVKSRLEPTEAVRTNVVGTINALACARRRRAVTVLLSTSRVYPIDSLRALASPDCTVVSDGVCGGVLDEISNFGVPETFGLSGRRSVYGATKLADEVLALEFGAAYDFPVYVNRCGLLTGSGQIGSSEQGLIGLWVGAHLFGLPLVIKGYGGRQVRDVLDVDDLSRLIVTQIGSGRPSGIWNVGGGPANTVSILGLTRWCREYVGLTSVAHDPAVGIDDIPWFVSDVRKAWVEFEWFPRVSVRGALLKTHSWLFTNRDVVRPFLDRGAKS